MIEMIGASDRQTSEVRQGLLQMKMAQTKSIVEWLSVKTSKH